MIQSRLGRIVASTVLAGAAVAALSTPAFAAKGGIACSSVKGNATTNVSFKTCTGNTGGSSKPLPASALTSGGTVKWKNGTTTTITLSVKAGDNSKCAAGSSEFDASGKVTADTTGSVKINGKVAASVCVSGTGAVSLVKGTKATIA